MGEQHPHRLRPARARRCHEDGLASVNQGGIRVRSGLEQRLDHLGIAVGRRQCQRLNPIAVGGLRVGACAQQFPGGREIIGAHRPVERCRSIGCGRIRQFRVLQQLEQRRPIARLDRVDDQRSSVGPGRMKAGQRAPRDRPHAASISNIHPGPRIF